MTPYEQLQQDLARGWNTWNTRSVLSHVLMPEGFALNLGIREYRERQYLKEALIGRHGPADEQIHPGGHAYDGSYTQLTLRWMDMEYIVESAHDGEDLVLRVEPVLQQRKPATLIVELGVLWNRPGSARRDDDSVFFEANGRKIGVYCTAPMSSELNIPAMGPYLCARLDSPVGISTGRARSLSEIEGILARQRENLEAHVQDFGEDAELYRAMQCALGWNTIYEPSKGRVCTPVSRIWNTGWWGGYVLFCWDTYFAAAMAGVQNRALAYANAVEITREHTEQGFVPNFAAASDYKSRDRSQPPVGSRTIWDLYARYHDLWLLEETYEDLLAWNQWFYQRRQLSPGLMAWGSDPYEPLFGALWESNGVNERYGASLESGLDNSPMYDDVRFDSERHLLLLSDVGLTGLYIMDCLALSRIAGALGKAQDQAMLEGRAELFESALETLWDEQSGMYCNRHADGTFSQRLSPTNFYALHSRKVSPERARRMLDEHFYNHKEFWGEWFMPSIRRDDPAYPDQDYWRGRIWGPMNYLVYLALRERGLQNACADMAERSARLLLKEWLEHGHIHENYNADTGEGDDVRNSDKFYHWGALLSLIALMEHGRGEGAK